MVCLFPIFIIRLLSIQIQKFLFYNQTMRNQFLCQTECFESAFQCFNSFDLLRDLPYNILILLNFYHNCQHQGKEMADFTDAQLKIINEMMNNKLKDWTLSLILSNVLSLITGGTIGFFIGKAS